MALRMAMYRVQTFILVFREALATGAGSVAVVVPLAPLELPSGCWDGDGGVTVIRGVIVERASGSLRVRKRVDDCRYVFET